MPHDLPALAQQYAQDGVVRIRSLYDAAQLGAIRQAIARYGRELAPTLPAKDVTFEADGKTVRNLWRMNVHDAFFAQLAAESMLLDLVTPLVRGEPVLLGVETFSKPAKVGSGVPPHQDNAYFCQSPPDVLTVWVAIDPVTEANGPVFYARGSHRLGMLAHRPSGVAGNSMGLAAPFDKANPFVGTLEPGDALVHHCQTIHYSSPNRTDRPRCGLLFVFRGSHTQRDEQLYAQYTLGGAAG